VKKYIANSSPNPTTQAAIQMTSPACRRTGATYNRKTQRHRNQYDHRKTAIPPRSRVKLPAAQCAASSNNTTSRGAYSVCADRDCRENRAERPPRRNNLRLGMPHRTRLDEGRRKTVNSVSATNPPCFRIAAVPHTTMMRPSRARQARNGSRGSHPQ